MKTLKFYRSGLKIIRQSEFCDFLKKFSPFNSRQIQLVKTSCSKQRIGQRQSPFVTNWVATATQNKTTNIQEEVEYQEPQARALQHEIFKLNLNACWRFSFKTFWVLLQRKCDVLSSSPKEFLSIHLTWKGKYKSRRSEPPKSIALICFPRNTFWNTHNSSSFWRLVSLDSAPASEVANSSPRSL